MHKHPYWGMVIAGALAGAVNGLLGAGGGMILVPFLSLWTDLSEEEIFPASISIILPVCILSLWATAGTVPWKNALPYLLGSAGGGILAGTFGKRIPVIWLHRALGLDLQYLAYLLQ